MATKNLTNILNLPTNIFNAISYALNAGKAYEAYMEIARRTMGNKITEAFDEAWDGVICPAIIANSPKDAIRTNLVFGKFCPEIQHIRFDFLRSADVPHGIDLNSIYLTFSVNMAEQKVELTDCGSTYLSPYDKTTPRHRYMACRSIIDIAEEAGVKRFRKRGFKSAEKLAEILKEYADKVMEAVTQYTGGYPYKQGVLNTPLAKCA